MHAPKLLSADCLQGCRGPVHAQFVENWVAYHYFDVSNHRWEMSVLELYNKAQGNVTITDMVLGKTSNSMSSYDPVPVEVCSCSVQFLQSFLLVGFPPWVQCDFLGMHDSAHVYAQGFCPLHPSRIMRHASCALAKQ